MNLDLTHEELMLLDGKCSVANQEKIDLYKKERNGVEGLTDFQFRIWKQVFSGTMVIKLSSISVCMHCGQNSSYTKKGNRVKKLKVHGYTIYSQIGDGVITFCNVCETKHSIFSGLRKHMDDSGKPLKIKNHTRYYGRK